MELRPPTLLVTCVAGLISGAASMAADEYISIKSQQDIEKNALDMEARELKCHPEPELQKLKNFYIQRGYNTLWLKKSLNNSLHIMH